MRATIQYTNEKNGSVSLEEYEYIKGSDPKYKSTSDGGCIVIENPSRWIDKNGQEPIQQLKDLLNGDVGGVWVHLSNSFKLISKD